jgi:hypothetical protein
MQTYIFTVIPETIKLGCFYIIDMELATKLFATPVVLLIMGATFPRVYAWDYGPGNWGGGCEGCSGGQSHEGSGYYAGIQDAIYDHDNGYVYNPIGQCIPCHSDEYWTNFHEGYDHQWNTYQSQESNQGSSINIYGNNNYVSTSQYSNQQQNPLQQLAHTVCGWVNCNSGPGYEP